DGPGSARMRRGASSSRGWPPARSTSPLAHAAAAPSATTRAIERVIPTSRPREDPRPAPGRVLLEEPVRGPGEALAALVAHAEHRLHRERAGERRRAGHRWHAPRAARLPAPAVA